MEKKLGGGGLSRREFLRLVGALMGGGLMASLNTGALLGPTVLWPLSSADRDAIIEESISNAFETCQRRMLDLMPNGWPRLAISGSLEYENKDGVLMRLSPEVHEVYEKIKKLEGVDRSKAEMAVAKVVDGISGWRDFNDPSLWYLRTDRESVENQIEIKKIPVGPNHNTVDVLFINNVQVSEPMAGGIAHIDEAVVTPAGEIVGIGIKLNSSGANQRSLFMLDPYSGKIATTEGDFIPKTINNSWLASGIDGVIVFNTLPSGFGDNNAAFVVYSIGSARSDSWTSSYKFTSIPRDVQKALNLKVDSSGQLSILSVPAMSAQMIGDSKSIYGFVEVEVADGDKNRRSCVVSLDYRVPDFIKPMEAGENQKIIGRVDNLTIISHTLPDSNELLGVSFLMLDEKNGHNFVQVEFSLDAPFKLTGTINVGKYEAGGNTYIELTDEDGNLVFRKQLTFLDHKPELHVKGVKEVMNIHNMNNSFPEEVYRWKAIGNTERIMVDPNTVFIYIPGAGATVPENHTEIMTEMGWESTLHLPIFKAKFGEIGESMYMAYYNEMSTAYNYERMMSVMEKYGVFFIPWNMVVNKDGETSSNVPNLNMTFQAFRVINTLGNKNVVLIGHSKGAGVVQEMVKMVQEYPAKMLTGSSKIIGAIMYGRIVPPEQLIKIFSSEIYKSYDLAIEEVRDMLELDVLSTGIDKDKLDKIGLHAIEVYDPRDPIRFSKRILRELLINKKNLGVIGKILEIHAKEVLAKIEEMDFTPFPTTITRVGVPRSEVDRIFDAYFKGIRSRSDIVYYYHSTPDWGTFLPAILEHV